MEATQPEGQPPNINSFLITTLKSIQDAIYGNGHEGINARLARIEQTLADSAKINEGTAMVALENQKELNALTQSTIKLTASVETHHKTEHLSDLLRKPSFYVTCFVLLELWHALATYTPYILNWVLSIFKIPPLPIPQG